MKPLITFRSLCRSACFVVLSLSLAGCAASASHLDRLRVGMTRDEVEKAIGRPRSTTARASSEVLIYQLTDKPFGDGMIFPGTYYVQLNQGRVSGWSRDEEKDRLDHERAYRMNAAALAPPVRVNVEHSGYVDHNVNVNGTLYVRPGY